MTQQQKPGRRQRLKHLLNSTPIIAWLIFIFVLVLTLSNLIPAIQSIIDADIFQIK